MSWLWLICTIIAAASTVKTRRNNLYLFFFSSELSKNSCCFRSISIKLNNVICATFKLNSSLFDCYIFWFSFFRRNNLKHSFSVFCYRNISIALVFNFPETKFTFSFLELTIFNVVSIRKTIFAICKINFANLFKTNI